jgi:hypothetical protein
MPRLQIGRLLATVFVVAALALASSSIALADNYDGEQFCRNTLAWPGGSYLGQMHRIHVDNYLGFAAANQLEPCQKWAEDQRESAIRGLRDLGFLVRPPAPGPILLAGTGQSATPIRLTAGLWTVRASVNYESNWLFVSRLHALDSGDVTPLFAEAPQGRWASEIALRVGEGNSSDMPAGDVLVEVQAGSAWLLSFAKQGSGGFEQPGLPSVILCQADAELVRIEGPPGFDLGGWSLANEDRNIGHVFAYGTQIPASGALLIASGLSDGDIKPWGASLVWGDRNFATLSGPHGQSSSQMCV